MEFDEEKARPLPVELVEFCPCEDWLYVPPDVEFVSEPPVEVWLLDDVVVWLASVEPACVPPVDEVLLE